MDAESGKTVLKAKKKIGYARLYKMHGYLKRWILNGLKSHLMR